MLSDTSLADLISTCVKIGGPTPYSDADLRFAVTPFVHWAVHVGVDMELGELFTVRNIEMFIQESVPNYSAGVLGNVRTRLIRLSEQFSDPDGRRLALSALPASNPARPYEPRHIAQLMSWATTRTTPKMRASAVNLLALGLGAGLSTSEIANLRRGDVHLDAGATVLSIAEGRPRTVVMLQQWADELLLDDAVRTERYIFRPDRQGTWRNVVSNFVSSVPREVRPQPQRLRATWIVSHLNAGTNVLTLMRAAGVDSLEAFTRYIRFVAEPAADVQRAELSGA
ncbi:hypothetical protein M4D51_02800 [Microbacterium sp. p3-SID338]|uniref:hypothetical protein n=1 Tax=Microbacterium sp. p3-SID338 TaxID=2916214 RepID=UPI0021A35224|nr:hypothetical protein [Microbacterium sp. p3-SID338]MCT1394648.1 hypothetical protein [Microbacterium sp. p3-SID338]